MSSALIRDKIHIGVSDLVWGEESSIMCERRMSNSKPRVQIRPFHVDDLPGVYELYSHPQIVPTVLQLPNIEYEAFAEKRRTPPPNTYRYVAVAAERVVGHVNIHQNIRPRMQHSGAIGLMVHPDFWGQGIGTRLMEAVLDLADNWLNLSRIELDVNTDNAAAIRVYEKCGFVIEGTKRQHNFRNGRFVDSYFMARIKEA